MKTSLLCMLALGCGKTSGGPPMGGNASGLTPDNTLPEAPDTGDNGGTETDDTADPSSDADVDADVDADADADADTDADDTSAPVIEGTGYGRDDTAYNLAAIDQTGSPFTLHEQLGSKIVIVVGNLDVSTTSDTLSNLQEIASEHSDVAFLAFIGRDPTGTQCDQACAANVQSTYGFSPVLWEASAAMPTFTDWAQAMNTRTYIIDQSMTIVWTKNGTANGSQVDGELDDLD